jgi:hypothetical protein
MNCRCREFDYGRLFTSRDCRHLGGNNAVHIFKDYPLNRLIPLLGMSMRTRPQDPINTVIGANSMSAFLSKIFGLWVGACSMTPLSDRLNAFSVCCNLHSHLERTSASRQPALTGNGGTH